MSRQQRIPSRAGFVGTVLDFGVRLGFRRRFGLVVGFVVGALLAGIAARSAHAQEQGKRVVVVAFAGPGGGKIAGTAAEILAAAGYTVVPEREYRAAGRKLKVSGQDSEQLARLAAELELAAVVFGEIEKGAAGRQVRVRVHAGATGAEVAVIELVVQRRRLTPEEEEGLRSQLLPALERAVGGAGADEDAEAADVTDAAASEPAEQTADADADLASEALSRSEPAEAEIVQLRTSRAAVQLSAGLSFTSRFLRAEVSRQGISGPTYDGPPAPALFLGVEAYPAAFAPADLPARFILSNIGIQAQLERVFALTSEVAFEDGGQQRVEALDTTQMRLGLGLIYRLFFGDAEVAPVLRLGLGYERFQFEIDRGGLPAGVLVNLPDVTYAIIDPGLAFHYPVNDRLAVNARGRLLLVVDPGAMASAAQYGDTTSALGFDLGLDAEYLVMERLAVRAGVRLMDVTVGFEGNGMLSNNLDGDPSTQDVDGITDYYLGILATAGYLF
jgi:hypothetical protein